MSNNIVTIIALVNAVISGSWLITKYLRQKREELKRRDVVEFKRKGSDESVTVSMKGSKQDAKKLVDYMNRTARHMEHA